MPSGIISMPMHGESLGYVPKPWDAHARHVNAGFHVPAKFRAPEGRFTEGFPGTCRAFTAPLWSRPRLRVDTHGAARDCRASLPFLIPNLTGFVVPNGCRLFVGPCSPIAATFWLRAVETWDQSEANVRGALPGSKGD